MTGGSPKAKPRSAVSRKTQTAPEYAVHPSIAHMDAIVKNLPQTTGKSIQEWLRLVQAAKVKGKRELQEWLKREHSLGGTTVTVIAMHAEDGAEEIDPAAYLAAAVKYVEEQYGGPKAALRPIHDALIELGRSLGPDVKVSPCKTMVPLYRRHVFAQVKAPTRTRIDLGLALKAVKKKLPKRIEETGGLEKGDRITHRIALASLTDIDDEVKGWLRTAYNLDA